VGRRSYFWLLQQISVADALDSFASAETDGQHMGLLQLGCLLALTASASGLVQGLGPRAAVRAARSRGAVAVAAAGAELSMEPDAKLDLLDSIRVVCTGLEFNDYPTRDAGVTRLYNWMTPQGRVALAPPPPKGGTQTGVSLDFFLDEAGGAALGSLLSCSSWRFVGEASLMPATNAHGLLATQIVEVLNMPEDLTITDALDRPAVCEELLRAVKAGEPMPNMPATPVRMPRRTRFLISLEQQR